MRTTKADRQRNPNHRRKSIKDCACEIYVREISLLHNHITFRKEMTTMDKKQKYIVRCDRSGVFYGEIAGRNGQEVQLENVRCLWYWSGAASLLELAKSGVKNTARCKFTVSVDSITLLDAIELLPCTPEAERSIDGVEEWKA